ncbi:MAG: hypothetical protein IPM96_21140 [Ignavibacteria bacterium]|nr:hypothetical protein [Ignavibacteria bacterium]
MLKSSALKIIQSFSKEEISEFNDFLKSPYHNKKSGVVKLYNEIKKYYPDFKDENLDKEKLWSKLYPGKMYSYGVMKNLIFELTGLAENYIALNNFRQNELKMFSELSESLRMRKLNSVLESKNNILTKKFSDSGRRTIQDT